MQALPAGLVTSLARGLLQELVQCTPPVVVNAEQLQLVPAGLMSLHVDLYVLQEQLQVFIVWWLSWPLALGFLLEL